MILIVLIGTWTIRSVPWGVAQPSISLTQLVSPFRRKFYGFSSGYRGKSYTASKFALEAISEALAQEVKAFGIKVAVVQPGIINTSMANEIVVASNGSVYPHGRRVAGMFAASLKTPTAPELVADKVRQIIESDSPQFRHPVGPDAAPFLAWRASMSDEQWVDWGALDDASRYAAVERAFGLNARPIPP